VGEGRPEIRTAIDFAIDTPGNIYVTLADGTLLRYSSGQRQSFAFSNFPDGQSLEGVNRMLLNTNPTDQMIYFVSQGQRTVFQTTYAGTYAASYRPVDETLFASASDVAVDAVKNLIYVVSGNSVFVMSRAG
jgi:hypothetical protein